MYSCMCVCNGLHVCTPSGMCVCSRAHLFYVCYCARVSSRVCARAEHRGQLEGWEEAGPFGLPAALTGKPSPPPPNSPPGLSSILTAPRAGVPGHRHFWWSFPYSPHPLKLGVPHQQPEKLGPGPIPWSRAAEGLSTFLSSHAPPHPGVHQATPLHSQWQKNCDPRRERSQLRAIPSWDPRPPGTV